MRTMQIGKDGKMVDMGDVPCEYDPQPKPRMHKDFFDILVEAGVEESTRPDPFPPLKPEPTTDTAADRVLDAAMRSRIPKTNEVLFRPIGVNSMTILHEMARNQGKSFIALADGAGGGTVYRIIGHNVCKPHCKISDMDDKEASRADQME